jgi:hypothetical protein
MSDWSDDPKAKAWLDRVKAEMLPKMEASAMSVVILAGTPDPKLCVELGAAILLDKPIIILVPDDTPVPANLKRCATAIIRGRPSDPKVARELNECLKSVLSSDQRTRAKGPV